MPRLFRRLLPVDPVSKVTSIAPLAGSEAGFSEVGNFHVWVVNCLGEHISGIDLAKGSNNIEAHFGTSGISQNAKCIDLGFSQLKGGAVMARHVGNNNGVSSS